MNKQSKRYYKDVKAMIPAMGRQEKRLLEDYKARIMELNESRPDISYEELQHTLGSPVDIISEYYEGADTDYIIRQVRNTQFIRYCIFCILVLILVGFSISVGINIKLYHDVQNVSVTRESTTLH